MPHFKVILSGRGIDCAIGDDSAIGFFTTRLVKANNAAAAELAAQELVHSEWRPGGEYAISNLGPLPVLSVEQSSQVGFFGHLWAQTTRLLLLLP